MKKNIYFLICLSLVFLSMLFFPFYSKAALPLIPDVGTAVRVGHYGGNTTPTILLATSFICPNDCSGHSIACNSNGNGNNGTCVCYEPWTGADCSISKCPNGCSNTKTIIHGDCGFDSSCFCRYDW